MPGDCRLGQADLKGAVADYSHAIRLDPKEGTAFAKRAHALWLKNDYDEAISDSNEAIRLNQDFAHSYFVRGAVLSDTGEYERAIVDYNEAIRLEPGVPNYYARRAMALEAMGDYQQAMADYNKAIQLVANPRLKRPFCEWRGLLFYYLRRYERAIADYNEALQFDREGSAALADAYFGRGNVYYLTNRLDLAVPPENLILGDEMVEVC